MEGSADAALTCGRRARWAGVLAIPAQVQLAPVRAARRMRSICRRSGAGVRPPRGSTDPAERAHPARRLASCRATKVIGVLEVDSYTTAAWHDLFGMAGGAAATLAGLIFFAVSTNHEHILGSKTLPSLAARTLSVLVALLLMCVLTLAPGQAPRRLGAEILALGAALVTVVGVSTLRTLAGALLQWRLALFAVGAAATVPMVVGGISLVSEAGGGLYWLLLETITAFAASSYYAWILLIEIRR